MRGYLYVLTNPNMRGLVKIGFTERSPQERAAELSRATGVPGRFKVEKSWRIDQAQAHERKVHAALAAHRMSGEHYRLTVADAVEQISVMLRAGGIIGDDGLTAVERAQAAASAAEEAKRAAEAKRRAAEAAANGAGGATVGAGQAADADLVGDLRWAVYHAEWQRCSRSALQRPYDTSIRCRRRDDLGLRHTLRNQCRHFTVVKG